MFLNSRFLLFQLAHSALLIENLQYRSKTTSPLVDEQPLDITALSNSKANSS